MLNNLTNFFNLIRGRRIKTQLEPSDLIAIGTKQSPALGDYKPTAIMFEDLQAQLSGGFAKYKVYTALLSQSGTDAPVATILENTLGGNPIWSYEGVGQYFLTLNGAFPLDKTGCFIGANATQSDLPSFLAQTVQPNNPNAGSIVYVQCSGIEAAGYYTDDALLNTMIEIRVYN